MEFLLKIAHFHLLPKFNDTTTWNIFGTSLLTFFLPILILKAKFYGGEPDPLDLAVPSIVAFYFFLMLLNIWEIVTLIIVVHAPLHMEHLRIVDQDFLMI